MSDDYILTRVPRRWVPGWLWWLATIWYPLAYLLSEHDSERCQCSCHEQPGMRDCAVCGWTA